MAQHILCNTPRLYSIGGSYGEVQIVAKAGEVLIDVQPVNFVHGVRQREHATLYLYLNNAVELRDALNAAIMASANATPHAGGQWSDTTGRAVVRRSSRRAA